MLTPGIFITGTNTGVGKTVVSAALVRLLAGRGLRVAGLKPIATGGERAAPGMPLRNSDGLELQAASSRWQAFATLVLDASYEATLWAAALNAHRTASNLVYLTRVGGGAFGNETAWIDGAIRRALKMFAGAGLDVRLVSYGQPL